MKKKIFYIFIILSIFTMKYVNAASIMPNSISGLHIEYNTITNKLFKLKQFNGTVPSRYIKNGKPPLALGDINYVLGKDIKEYTYKPASGETYTVIDNEGNETKNSDCYYSNFMLCITPGLYDGTKDKSSEEWKNSDVKYKCTKMTNASYDSTMVKQIKYVLTSNPSVTYPGNLTYINAVKSVAARMIAGDNGYSKCGLNSLIYSGNKMEAAVKNALKIKCDRIMLAYTEYFSNGYSLTFDDYFSETNDTFKNILKDAQALAKNAKTKSASLATDDVYVCRASSASGISGNPGDANLKTDESSSDFQTFVAIFSQAEKCKKEDKPDDTNPQPDTPTEPVTCTPDVDNSKTVIDEIGGDLNNCCESEHNTVLYHNKLENLFVRYDCLGADEYTLKKNVKAIYGQDSKILNAAYCQLYCTERVEVAQPKVKGIEVNHYFKMDEFTYKNKKYTSPVVDSYKSCKVKIRFDLWIQSFAQAIQATTTNYNEYIRTREEWKYYTNAKNTGTNINITFKSKCQQTTYSSCPDYECASGDYAVYVPCASGYSGYGTCTANNPTTVGKPDKKGKCSEGSKSGDSCIKYDTYTAAVDHYMCYDKTKPISKADRSNSWTFGAMQYTFEDKYTYDIYETSTSGTASYPSIIYNINTSKIGSDSGNHLRYSIYNPNGIAYYKNQVSTWESEQKASMAGTVSCVKNGYSTSYAVSCSPDYGYLSTISGQYDELNVPERVTSLNSSLNGIASSYNTTVNEIYNLKKILDDCNNYFGMVDPKEYNPQPELDFYYEQAYLDDYGKPALGQIKINYKRVCVHNNVQVIDPNIYNNISPEFKKELDKIDINVDNIKSSMYSAAYGASPLNYRVFICSSTGGTCTTETARQILDSGSLYNHTTNMSVSTAFSHDGTFNTLCYWELDDEQNKLFVVPGSGAVIKTDSGLFQTNKGEIGRWFSKETALDGKYQTYANLTNLGEDGVFDDYVRKNGQSCAEKALGKPVTAKSAPEFTCPYSVKSNEITYGYCSDDITIDVKNCVADGELKYAFRVVDPDNLFPSCTGMNLNREDDRNKCYKSIGNYAYNWLKTEEGAKAIKEIQTPKYSTFDPNNLTYSFKLDSNTMKAIKEYNKEQLNHGGYKDFDLTCHDNCDRPLIDIPSPSGVSNEVITNPLINGVRYSVIYYNKACSRCYSKFLDNLAIGRVGNTYLNKTIWNNKKTLNTIRNEYSW